MHCIQSLHVGGGTYHPCQDTVHTYTYTHTQPYLCLVQGEDATGVELSSYPTQGRDTLGGLSGDGGNMVSKRWQRSTATPRTSFHCDGHLFSLRQEVKKVERGSDSSLAHHLRSRGLTSSGPVNLVTSTALSSRSTCSVFADIKVTGRWVSSAS